MKYIILTDIRILTKSVLGYAIVTNNPCKELKDHSYVQLKLYQSEEEMPEGKMHVRIQDGKVFTPDGIFGCEEINFTTAILFDPSVDYETLGTGTCKTVDLLNMRDYTVREKSFILVSDKDGPLTWSNCVFDGENLDFGGQEIIKVFALK